MVCILKFFLNFRLFAALGLILQERESKFEPTGKYYIVYINNKNKKESQKKTGQIDL